MAKECSQLLIQFTISFWLLFFCVSIFVIPKANIFEQLLTQNPFSRPNPEKASKTSVIIPNNINNNQRTSKYPFLKALQTAENTSDPCGGRYIYVHNNLPPRFNTHMLDDCENLGFHVRGRSMCTYIQNDGFGPAFEKSEGEFSTGWYETDQFSLDLIFHRRLKRYDCLTNDSSIAAAIYIPYYVGFDTSRNAYTGKGFRIRDELPNELINWLKNTSEWNVMDGRDHFLAAGKMTWEFRRWKDDDSVYGNKFLSLPEIQNISTLVIESSPWCSNDFAIPYPSYFHPSKDDELLIWQNRLRKSNRKWLFSFAGARMPNYPDSVRNTAYDECENSKSCNLFQCEHAGNICSAKDVINVFENSIFCLQPPGDSPTRRSTFDSMLAGCIPVFFHPSAAYVQYIWHLPKRYSSYSVFISEVEIKKNNISIEEKLRQIPAQKVEEMKERVIELIPSLIYGDPRSKLWTFKDAFDLAIEGVIRKVTKWRKHTIDGRKKPENFLEALSWKYALLDKDEDTPPEKLPPNEWDPFFKWGGGNK